MESLLVYNLIVSTADVLQGSPRLKGRRLAVGDVVSGVGISENISEYMNDFGIKQDEIVECLDYCRRRQCIVDSPIKFCHNCTLRVLQDQSSVDDEQDNWLRAEKLYQIFLDTGNA